MLFISPHELELPQADPVKQKYFSLNGLATALRVLLL